MLNGIDIYHGDNISPQSIADMIRAHQLYFAFIKTGTGALGKDRQFMNYWQICRSAGLVCSAYHWFWPTTDPTLQALNFLDQYYKVSRAGVLPPIVDIEWTWNSGDTQTDANELWHQVVPAQRTSNIKEYLNRIELELNVKPIIYTATNFWNELIEDHSSADDNIFFGEHLLWIADPNNNGRKPLPWKNQQPAFTQTHFGEAAHSSDPFDKTDQDTFNGTLLEFLNTAAPGFTLMQKFPFSFIVKDLQRKLQEKGFLHDVADGFFGKKTFEAVAAFQTANALVGNGIIDAQTWNKLLS
jgi:lysozyme